MVTPVERGLDEPIVIEGSATGTPVPVSGPLTDTQLRASDVKVTLDSEQVDVSDRAARDLGGVDIVAALPAGTNLIGKVGIDQTTPGTTNAVSTYGKTGDSTYQVPRIDVQTHALETIEYEHHEIHAGSHFFISGVQDLSINQVLDFTWQTPNTAKWTHWLWKISTESETAWYVYETAVATNPLANGITPLNNNRNSLTDSGTTMKYEIQANLTAANADTDVTTATLVDSGISGAGKISGNDRRENEIILKQNTLYCLRAIATAAGYIDFDMQWYEHTARTA